MKKLLLLVAFLALFTYPVLPQMSDACSDGQVIVVDATNKRYKCVNASLPLVYRVKGVNINSANTDVGTVSGLPVRYIVRRVTVDNASITPTLGTFDLRTATAGGGTAVVSAQALLSLSGTTKYIDATVAVTADVLTASTLTIRCVAAVGSTATADFTIEVTPLL